MSQSLYILQNKFLCPKNNGNSLKITVNPYIPYRVVNFISDGNRKVKLSKVGMFKKVGTSSEALKTVDRWLHYRTGRSDFHRTKVELFRDSIVIRTAILKSIIYRSNGDLHQVIRM